MRESRTVAGETSHAVQTFTFAGLSLQIALRFAIDEEGAGRRNQRYIPELLKNNKCCAPLGINDREIPRSGPSRST
jgi:hypothetical protein